jgi:GntR family transcriptional regulator/MocR family aminotransferase
MANSPSISWATSGVDLLLELDRPGGTRARIENALRDAIRSGRLPRGTRLPATRVLARDLGVSRGTVLAAYTQLTAEGWLRGVRGSGTVVAAEAADTTSKARPAPGPPRFDFRPGRPDASSFPRAEWLRALRSALVTAPDEALGYGDPRGRPELRDELAVYLRRARGLQVSADNIVVTNGYSQALNLIARALPRTRVAIENPSMREHRSAVRAAGHELRLLPVDAHGARIDKLGNATIAVLTPNRQHPLGCRLSAERRSALLEWARSTGGFVVEDDYDGEFRYDGHPLGALQGLEPQSVIYAGTASKTLAPGVRLGWLAVPDELLDAIVRAKSRADVQTGALDQLALGRLLATGAYDRHIRKMRLRYRRRRDTMLAALAKHAPHLTVTGAAAGLNLLVELPDSEAERRLIDSARKRGVAIDGLLSGGFFEGKGRAGVIIGYAASPEHAYASAVRAFSRAL